MKTTSLRSVILCVLLELISASVSVSGTELVSVISNGSQSNSRNEWPTISIDSRYVTFLYLVDNLVGDDTNGYADIFVHSRIVDTDSDSIQDKEDNSPTMADPEQEDTTVNQGTNQGGECNGRSVFPYKNTHISHYLKYGK